MTSYDGYNFLSPAKVKILLVPVNDCTVVNFRRFAALLKNKACELWSNWLASQPEEKQASEWCVLPEFLAEPTDKNQVYLHEFEPFRKVFVVIGIGIGTGDSEACNQENISQLKKLYSTAIVHDTVFFECSESAIEDQLRRIFSAFKASLREYASAYSAITLRSPVSITDSHVLTRTITQAQKRLSAGSTSFRASFNGSSGDSPKPSAEKPRAAEKAKTQSKFAGRHSKLMGNFHLLAGEYIEAITSFTESLSSLKRHDDYLWLGSALEGLAVSVFLLESVGVKPQLDQSIITILNVSKSSVMESANGKVRRSSVESNGSRASAASPRNSMGSNGFSLPLSLLSDINSLSLYELLKIVLTKAIYYYSQSTSDLENMVPDVVYIECILRKIGLMVGTRVGSVDDPVMELVLHRETSDSSAFSNQDIFCDIDKIFSLQLVDLDVLDQCKIFSFVASVYRSLRFYRKEAFIMRFQLIALMPKLGNHNQIANVKESLERIFHLYGITASPESSARDAKLHSQGRWTSLQIQVLKLALNIAELSNDDEMLSGLCILTLTRFSHCLPVDDQNKLRTKIEERIKSCKVPYWDPFLVRKVKFVSTRLKEQMMPFENHNHQHGQAAEGNSEAFFDPYNVKPEVTHVNRIVVKDELHQLKVTLQNPLAFEIEINDLEVACKGVKVVTLKDLTQVANLQQPASNINSPVFSKLRTAKKTPTLGSAAVKPTLVIPPFSVEQIMVTFKALEVGELEIEGFYASVCCCEKQFFPIIDKEVVHSSFRFESEAENNDINNDHNNNTNNNNNSNSNGNANGNGNSNNDTTHNNSKEAAIDVLFANLKSHDLETRALHRTLPLTVIKPQPSLQLKEISLSSGWVMLLEGESVDFTVTLVNDSHESINYLSFSFWDSAIDVLNRRLRQMNLHAAEVYDVEWQLLNFKSFKIKNKGIIGETIRPMEELTIEYEVTGRKMMKESRITLDYAHRSHKQSYIKQLDIALNVTVMPSIEIVGCDIVHLFSKATMLNGNLPDVVKPAQVFCNLHEVNEAEYCLLVLDLRNSWSDDLQCFLKYESFKVNYIIENNKTTRFILPMKKISTQVESKPVPSLRKKQFIKDYSLTEAEEEQMRKMFWLKQDILNKLEGTWKTVEGKKQKQGVVDFRGLKMTPRMARIVVRNDVTVETHLLSNNEEVVEPGNLKVDEYYILRTTIRNDSSEEIRGRLRQLPLADTDNPDRQVSTDRKILIEGSLHKMSPLVPQQSSVVMDVSFTIIERGEYEWRTIFDFGKCQSSKPIDIVVL
ncbi:uncharacterized protein LODBEIA_P19920 [Lodderomyces beijingensis]|uniref:Trafficking protein particle complex subunit 11 domain-containing protein n=1 Tax=Lodderomyces beijingensis TaxID=1775926 RepID=A0ABP0ZHY2_9ASCO